MKKLKKIRITILLLLFLNIFLVNELLNTSKVLKEMENTLENSAVYISQLQKLTSIGRLTDEHIHSDIKIFIQNKEINLNIKELEAPEYGTIDFWKTNKVSKFVHLHEGVKNIGVIHVHAKGIKLGMFLTTINAVMNDTCLKLPQTISNNTYCDDEKNTLKVYVNGKQINNPQYHEFKDLDQILISYGNQTNQELKTQLSIVGNISCISSENCVKE